MSRWLSFGILSLAGGAGPALAQADGTDRLAVVPALALQYDTNLPRTDEDVTGGKDNVRATPSLDIVLQKRLGRFRLRGQASIGYDFNSRFKNLDRLRISAEGSATVRLGGRCQAQPQFSYQRFQTDAGDLGGVEANATDLQTYGLTFSCPREAGLSPRGIFTHSSAENSAANRRPFDYRYNGVWAGVDYARPSLGTLSLFGRWEKIERPNIQSVIPGAGGTRTDEYGVRLTRAVAARVRGSIGISYLQTDPEQAGVPGFSGIGYHADLSILPSPMFVVTIAADRSIAGESSFAATYSVLDQYRARIDWQLSARSALIAAFARAKRDIRGEDPTFATPRGGEVTDSLGLTYRYDIRGKYRIDAGVSRRWRDAEADQFDYHATVAALSFGARF